MSDLSLGPMRSGGYAVTPAHEMPTNVSGPDDAPMMQAVDGRMLVLPDLLASRGGRQEFSEVKWRERLLWSKDRERHEIALSLRSWAHYVAVQEASGVPVRIWFLVQRRNQFACLPIEHLLELAPTRVELGGVEALSWPWRSLRIMTFDPMGWRCRDLESLIENWESRRRDRVARAAECRARGRAYGDLRAARAAPRRHRRRDLGAGRAHARAGCCAAVRDRQPDGERAAGLRGRVVRPARARGASGGAERDEGAEAGQAVLKRTTAAAHRPTRSPSQHQTRAQGRQMATKTFDLAALLDMDDGRIRLVWERSLTRVIDDCIDRPGVKAKRKLSLTATVEPLLGPDGELDSVDIQFVVDDNTPRRESRAINMVVARGKLLFNEMSRDSAKQGTLDEVQDGVRVTGPKAVARAE